MMANLAYAESRKKLKAIRKAKDEQRELRTLTQNYKHPLSKDTEDDRPYLNPSQHSRIEYLKVQYIYVPLRIQGLTDTEARDQVWPELKPEERPQFDVDEIKFAEATKAEQNHAEIVYQ